MTRQILNKGSTHSVGKLMMYCVILVKGYLLTNYSCISFMALFYGTWTILQLVLFVPHGESVCGGFGVFRIVHIAAYYLL